ncbi:MAG: citramalate synthase [Magnetococcales bacterium]|nr:citramalate synthase [Magnetococcales bacterium]
MADHTGHSKRVELFDTTLRDGSQSEDVLFSAEDKLRITELLDELGVDFIEGGWPGANPKDVEYFNEVKKLPLKNSKIVAFGSTRRAGNAAADDPILQGLLKAETNAITIFGKTWDLHVTRALGIPLEQNLELIHDSVRYLKSRVDTVVYDAEHYFDGYKADPEYALKTIEAAHEGGADCLVLCDTNGGCLADEVSRIVEHTKHSVGGRIGIHCHNDSELAVANSLAAVRAGAEHVQGTINGIGERCGNANLVSVIPNLLLKMGCRCSVTLDALPLLTPLSRFLYERINRIPQKNQPFVGSSAFAHKGGIHVSAVLKDSKTYEHIKPELVGNRQRVLVSEQSGRSNLIFKLKDFGIDEIDSKDPRMQQLLLEIKKLEHRGYQFDGADASFELRVRKALNQVPNYFSLCGFRVIDERWFMDLDQKLLVQNGDEKAIAGEDDPTNSPYFVQRTSVADESSCALHIHFQQGSVLVADASVRVRVGDEMEHTAAIGNGPIHALDKALRKALIRFYPTLKELVLEDFTVRIHRQVSTAGSDAVVRVLIQSRDGDTTWGTVGVNDNIIAASYDALVDAVTYKLYKDGVLPPTTSRTG